jgi:hypothetical protein
VLLRAFGQRDEARLHQVFHLDPVAPALQVPGKTTDHRHEAPHPVARIVAIGRGDAPPAGPFQLDGIGGGEERFVVVDHAAILSTGLDG